MQRILSSFILAVLIMAVPYAARAGNRPRSAASKEPDYPSAVIAQALDVAKKALPSPPPGWVVAETAADLPRIDASAADTQVPRFTYAVTFRRVQGIREAKTKLDNAYAESLARNEEAIKPRIAGLLKIQNEIAVKLRRATRRRNQHEIDRLNAELDENGRTMRALHEETDKKICSDVDPFLVKDAEATIRISVNAGDVEFPGGEPLTVPRSAVFARRREGERAGPTTWKEGQTLVLFGDWKEEEANIFHAGAEQKTDSAGITTVTVLFTGDKKRIEALIKKTDFKAMRSLLR